MSWRVEVNAYGTKESTEVEAPTVSEALSEALTELGFDENDEGTLTINISGEA